MNEIKEILRGKGISPTPVRILVYRCLRESSSPKSLSDLEIALESVDKSTISRTLSLFRENRLLHCFNDGSGSVKYELCKGSHTEEDDSHVHFRCEKCGETICLKTLSVPHVILPEGYEAHESNFIITGICSRCRN